MKLLFKQRIFSWLDSYDIYDRFGRKVYIVKGKPAWAGHKLVIYDADSRKMLGKLQENVFTFLPKFKMYVGKQYVGYIRKDLSFMKPKFSVHYNGWQVKGNIWERNYRILTSGGSEVATVSKQLLRLSDTYSIDVHDPEDALCALMVVLSIDAEKDSRGRDAR